MVLKLTLPQSPVVAALPNLSQSMLLKLFFSEFSLEVLGLGARMGVCSVLGAVFGLSRRACVAVDGVLAVLARGGLLEETNESWLGDTLPQRHLPGRMGQGGQSEEAWPTETKIIV